MRYFLLATALTLATPAFQAGAAEDVTRYVKPHIGTGGHGHTYPGAATPFGMVSVSPDTYNSGWDWCSGYHYSDSSIMGFSHTHLSGTGIGDMLDFLVMPATGSVKTVPGTRENPGSGYRSRFSHDDEIAEPGYYSVLLKDYGIKAELTASPRAGIHKYTFPQSDSAYVIFDLEHAYGAKSPVQSAELKIMPDGTITGGRRVGAWARGRHIYFAFRISKQPSASQIVSGGKTLDASVREASGTSLKVVLQYMTAKDEVIYVKVGVSGVSAEGALHNLEAEIAGWDFDKVRKGAHDAWQRELSKIAVTGGSVKQKEILYTSFYHTMLGPSLFDDVDGQYRGMDGKIHRVPEGLHNYSTFSLWDTYRSAHPLLTLTQPGRVPDFLNCLVRMGEESPAGAPIWPLQGVETHCMTGYHVASVFAEAQTKGFKGIDYERAYAVVRKRALEDNYRGLGYLRKLGYIPSDRDEESATKTLEYSYDAWAVAQMAKALGKQEDYVVLMKQSASFRNLFDKAVGFIRPKLENGEWAPGFDPTATGTTKRWRDFTESNSWQGTWAAQHDPAAYIELLGSREAFVNKLDRLFTEKPEIKGEVPLDMTGLVGMYAHGNEPSHHVAYLYDYAGAPYKTQERVRDLLDSQYNNQPEGLAGNEDVGQMSAWYIMSALGFYAVNPASGNYVFGSPLFDSITIDMGGNRRLVVEARRKSPTDKYIQSVTLNGKPHANVWFSHAEIANGGKLVFQMSGQPNRQFGASPAAAPPSAGTVK
jgi:predicted alpha-1,2-mannosidase